MNSGMIVVIAMFVVQAGGIAFAFGKLFQKVANDNERLKRIEKQLNGWCKGG